ncbi:sulfotransferase [Nonomuraea sp. KM90]|uniref:sulfotransferase n=1 Tax=Nonomuraea sp. KM90 TaxID=3457428 RepID=UPI003FCED4D7
MLNNVLRPAPPPPIPPGWQTGPPDFVGVGSMKSGTSWWWAVLAGHPAVATPRQQPADATGRTPATPLRPPYGHKEVHFFDHYGQIAEFDPATYHHYFPRPPGHLVGEWTPRYMYDLWTPPMLHTAAPDTKLLVLLRDPLQRLLSALAAQQQWFPSAPLAVIMQHQFHRSFYWRQLRWLTTHFPREQLLVLQYEQCVTDPAGQARRTFAFLGLDTTHWQPGRELTEKVGRTYPRPTLTSATTKAFLHAIAPDTTRLLQEFPHLEADLWPSLRTLRKRD